MTSPDAPAGALARLRGAWRRWALWFALVLVVVGLLATLVWLARGHEIEQTQRDLDRDNADAAQVLRQRLARNLQDLHGLAATHADPISWWTGATQLLHEHREWMRLQWHDAALNLRAVADSPFYPALAPPPPDGSTHHPSDIANLAGTLSAIKESVFTEETGE